MKFYNLNFRTKRDCIDHSYGKGGNFHIVTAPGRPHSTLSQIWQIFGFLISPLGAWFLDLNSIYNNPVYETAKETQMYRTVLWTLWERERVGRFGRMALKHVKYHV